MNFFLIDGYVYVVFLKKCQAEHMNLLHYVSIYQEHLIFSITVHFHYATGSAFIVRESFSSLAVLLVVF